MDLRDYFWCFISGTTWDVSNQLQGCKWCNKTPTAMRPLSRFFGTREDKSSWCFKPFHHISHFSRQHFRTVLPMWPACLVVILWKIDWNPSRLGCKISAKSGEIRRVEREASESKVEKHCSMKCHCASQLFSHRWMWWLGIASHRSMCFFFEGSSCRFFLRLHISYIAPFNPNEPFQWHLWQGGPRIEKRPCHSAKVWFAVHFGLEGCGWNNEEDEIA